MRRRHEISKQEMKVLKKYHKTLDIEILKTICDERIAHVIDVILKEAIRTYKEDDLSECSHVTDKSITTKFVTSYKLFDPNLVFFGEDDENDEYWGFPITIYKSKEARNEMNWEHHNYIYTERYEYLDEDGLLCNYYQDIDIFSTEKEWTWDLTQALFMVIYEAHEYWLELRFAIMEKSVEDDLDKKLLEAMEQAFEKSMMKELSDLATKSKDELQDISESE